eukprot:CAMPEP_0178800192 /NCGR_PEP_ID=MMETSP0745-20121128/12702_1 /TAXON_ID=913974 /ORGANISM="Nitzschia punctata, Strain CCMP561" /LENGTH=627 /DNA_ID=CAMNT_0020458983 /DNA_START=17 /DNA_END=1901 /DNA_ORIENTATION=+
MANNPPNDSSSGQNPPRPSSLLSNFLFSQLASSLATSEEDHHPTTTRNLPPVPNSLLASTLPPSLEQDMTAISSAGPTTAATTQKLTSGTKLFVGKYPPPSLEQDMTAGSSAGPTTAATTAATATGAVPPRPRRLWNVQDTSLKPIPPYYPPLDPNCTALVTDVPPSLVVVRITECLRKRSIAAEYDEDSVTAWCMTVDRLHFTIQLYRDSANFAALSSASPAVVVECQRQSGSVTSFHAACRAILQAAKGMGTGDDDREAHATSGVEFPSLLPSSKRRKLLIAQSQRYPASRSSSISDPTMAAEAAFEGARELLQKDRLECQQLGMERLVNLTSIDIAGQDTSRYVSRRILQDDWLIDVFLMHPEAEQAMAAIRGNSHARGSKSHKKGNNGNNSSNDETTALIRSFLESSVAVTPSPRLSSSSQDRNPSSSASQVPDDLSPDELRHEARLRALALRVLCNALHNVSQAGELQNILLASSIEASPPPSSSKRKHRGSGTTAVTNTTHEPASRLIQPPFLLSLVQDMQGVSRPPSVSDTGYKLASVHEAALAIRCLRLLAGNVEEHDDMDNNYSSNRSPQAFVRDFLRNEVVLESLELARACGRATHSVLQQEAERAYTQLTEDARSC